MSKLPKIANCSCGNKADLFYWMDGSGRVAVSCLCDMCPEGPTRKTERGAINAWNKRMGKA